VAFVLAWNKISSSFFHKSFADILAGVMCTAAQTHLFSQK